MNSVTGVNTGDGKWIIEDRGGNSAWNFTTATPTVGSAQMAWNNMPYNTSDQSYVNSPCFDMSAYTKPAFSLSYLMDVRKQQDGAVLQYSTNVAGGVQVWKTVGSIGSGQNWYSTQGVSGKPGDPFNSNFYGWSEANSVNDWTVSKNPLDAVST